MTDATERHLLPTKEWVIVPLMDGDRHIGWAVGAWERRGYREWERVAIAPVLHSVGSMTIISRMASDERPRPKFDVG
ncbi:hypothetical protein LRS10_09500 [Phenylobacterium sp. J426]|uniref:hypothetical protein n=1 Tax=Phenylobacterium sp. J426 TaxID=2898439 RepID=UPI00215074B3|nr:hypothetical protein [Phenylobacterium sp. J426]MCR5874377.1 hypothetical protein [Phenylobacterium sp. J426]